MVFFRVIDFSRLPTLGDKPNQPKNLHFQNEAMAKQKSQTECSSRNGLNNGDGFTMTALVIKYFVICASWH